MSNQKTLIVLAGLAIVIGGVAFIGGDFPAGSDQASGTIVPAERYRGEQISSEDIVLGDDSIAQFMQTDEFELLRNDEVFLEAISQEAFQTALANESFQQALANESFQQALANESFQQALAN
ncbi:MAG: hypothetical protein GQ538_11175, partial [Xanthomonadales bacterium]|nr:hypothetical protein [Xanthomonadales bacterium]